MKQNGEKQPRSFFLHCDECHHEVDFEGLMGREHVGYPCPLCKADMLTEADFDAALRIQAAQTVMIEQGLMTPAGRNAQPGPGEIVLRHHYHNGVLKITERAE